MPAKRRFLIFEGSDARRGEHHRDTETAVDCGRDCAGLAIVVCLVLYPIGLALWVSLTSSAGALTLQHYVDFFASGDSYRALLRTLGLALATTAASLLLSIPLGYLGRIPG